MDKYYFFSFCMIHHNFKSCLSRTKINKCKLTNPKGDAFTIYNQNEIY